MSDEEKPLKTNRILMATGFAQLFSDSLNNRFNNLLVAATGATVHQMGFLQGAKSLSSNLLQLVFGRLADRYGKKKFIAAGRILNAGAIAALLLYQTPEPLIWLVILSSFFNSMSLPTWNSLLGDYTTDSTRGKTIGLINSISQLGSFVAMIIAFTLTINQQGDTTPDSYRIVFMLSAATSLISGVMVLFTTEKPPKSTHNKLQLSRFTQDPRLRKYLILNFLYGIAMSFAWPFFPLVITHRLNMKIWQISSLSLASALMNTLTQRRMGGFMDRIGRRPIVVFSRVLMAVAPLAYALASQWWHIAIAELFLGIGMAAWQSSESTYIIDLAPGDLRATYLASSTAAFGLASFIGSNLGGAIVDGFFNGMEGLNMGLYISSVLRLAAGLAFLTMTESMKKAGKES
ncbi:MFS transporter [Candidatus Bathyarchaeota archaeon]|nr:MAG: MFS transporter [Candidatus Bathyarchaeota archaeon]